jgi:hypothetical protein
MCLAKLVNFVSIIVSRFRHCVVCRVSSAFEFVHSDVWGPINITANKFHYFVTFVDDFSRMTWLFLMQNRLELFSIFPNFSQYD